MKLSDSLSCSPASGGVFFGIGAAIELQKALEMLHCAL